MPDYIPKKDTEYQDWLGNFITVANANLVALGLVAADITPLQTVKTGFDNSLTDLEAKKAAMKAATQKKDTLRKSSTTKARALVKKIQANQAVTNELKASLQITVTGSHPAPPEIPYPPNNLVAYVSGSGEYKLDWKRNGNSSGILFVIEARMGNSSAWLPIFTTTKTSYTHSGNPPGTKITYRVKAQRGETQSPPSNTAVVNDGGVVTPTV